MTGLVVEGTTLITTLAVLGLLLLIAAILLGRWPVWLIGLAVVVAAVAAAFLSHHPPQDISYTHGAPQQVQGQMNTYGIEVRIMPREGLLDPAGKAVEHALQALDFEDAAGVTMGRLIRLHLEAADSDDARRKADEMCRKLLANPVTEDYAIAVEEA